MDKYRVRTTEAQVIYIQVHQLLGSYARVVKQPKQCVVPLSQQRLTIDLNEEALDFRTFQVLRNTVCSALERNSKNRLAVRQVTWVYGCEILKERMN